MLSRLYNYLTNLRFRLVVGMFHSAHDWIEAEESRAVRHLAALTSAVAIAENHAKNVANIKDGLGSLLGH